jgi:hypothetical protein
MPPVVLLGPQRFTRTLAEAVRDAGVEGRIAVVSAGWQEREREDDELRDHLQGRTVNLLLYARGEEAFAADPELFAAHRDRQDLLRRLQELYRQRLAFAKDAARALFAREGDPALLEPERRHALEALRDLDDHHLRRVRQIRREFDERWQPLARPAVARQVEAIGRVLADCEAVGIAGGHVAVLLNRLRLFGLDRALRALPVFAWSGGAMVAADRLVLFHDSPPQGAGNAEVLEEGLGLCQGVVPLPHARRRLHLAAPLRVALVARRFAPAAVLALEDGGRVTWEGFALRGAHGVRQLTAEGALVDLAEERT